MTINKYPHCGNHYHWCHAFSKFGYDDGEGTVETPEIAKLLESAGYTVKYGCWSPHNTIIYSIQKDGYELMPVSDPDIRIGYDDPRIYLPDDIQVFLNEALSAGNFHAKPLHNPNNEPEV